MANFSPPLPPPRPPPPPPRGGPRPPPLPRPPNPDMVYTTPPGLEYIRGMSQAPYCLVCSTATSAHHLREEVVVGSCSRPGIVRIMTPKDILPAERFFHSSDQSPFLRPAVTVRTFLPLPSSQCISQHIHTSTHLEEEHPEAPGIDYRKQNRLENLMIPNKPPTKGM